MLRIWTDGAFDRESKRGAWAWIASDGSEACGWATRTSSPQMELRAAIEAVHSVPVGHSAEIISDSEYVVKGATLWLAGWVRRGWTTMAGDPVKNRDLWQALRGALAERPLVMFTWVRGHSGDEGNERADRLATFTLSSSAAGVSDVLARWKMMGGAR